jgi:hypothetical protein
MNAMPDAMSVPIGEPLDSFGNSPVVAKGRCAAGVTWAEIARH